MNYNFENDKNYLNSSSFENDKNYWKNQISDIGNYVKFHNITSNNYKNIIISFNNESLFNFLENNKISQFNFMTAIFTLYLSRIDRTKGCLLKTNIPENNEKLSRNTLLKIEYNKNYPFIEYIKDIENVYDLALKHTRIDISNYIDEDLSYYSINNLTNPENISNINNECSALTLNVYDDYLDLVYNSDLFSDIYIQHMANNLKSLIDNLSDCPEQFLKDINIISSDELMSLADFSKGKIIDVDKDKIFSRAFREHAVNNPSAIAVDDGVNQVSYGELEKSSNSIAYDLKENYGISLNGKIALMLPRNYHFPELVLALNKIGACFIPIDPIYPINRIEHMLNIAEAESIITTREFAEAFDFKINIICIEDLNDGEDVDMDIMGKGDDLFAIMFTSGTTGLPKGVMVANKQISLGSVSFKNIFNFSYGDVAGCYLSFSFIASHIIFATLFSGGCSRIFNEKEQKDSLLLIKELKENHMNSLILPPGVGVPIFENEDLNLDYLVLAGAKLNELSKKERHTKIVNFYGTTEFIFGISKIYDINDIKENHVPIGRPIANSWVYILDKDGSQMPIGVPGEICISSDQISPGYYNDADLTGQVFMDNPYSTCEDNRRMYRTGDIGFYNFDGEIEIIGREDDQLSVRGFRIESNEILKIMKSFKEISDIYLDVDHDNLVAYYTTNADFDIMDVKEVLKVELPYYMIPSLFVELDEIPLTPIGKIDKSSLKNIFNESINVDIDDEILKVVIDSFKDVLNCDFVLMDDDFVELGGNSLSAMNLQLLIKERLGVYLSSSEIIELSTPSNISNHVKYASNIDDINVDYTFEDSCPLSESQLNVYLDETVNEMGTAYNNPLKIEFSDDYSIDEIKSALNKLFEIYPILSARVYDKFFLRFDGTPEVREGTINDVESFVQPFELDKNLSRFLIVENGKFNILCLDIHHLIFDGTSANILIKKIFEILNGSQVDLIDDGVLRQISFEENINSQYLEDGEEFFKTMLANHDDFLDLLPSVDVEDFSNYMFTDELDVDEDNLNSFLRKHHITHNQFFTSVFAYTLSRFTGSSNVSFNLVGDGRGHVDLSDSVGMFVRTLPLIFDCSNQSIDSFMNYSKGLITSVMKYDLYPFHILANEYDLSSNIFFQYAHDIFINPFNHEVNELKHDLIGEFSFFIFNSQNNNLGIKILHSNNYSEDFVERFAESYKLILHEMIVSDELSEVNFTTSDDLELLDNYNQTEADLLYDDILDGFNDNLSKYPNNNLVSYEGKCYSYAQGAFIIDKIAKKLIELGVTPQDCVAFLIERCENYLFAALGILSIGAVYVPLDDAYPNERVKFMLEDTDSKVIIVSDETYERAKYLNEDSILLNISDILREEIGLLSYLPVTYGNLACILYTSGTTGIPKGVKITRKAIISFASFQAKLCSMKSSDVFAMYSSIGFDVAAIRGICVPIIYGACLDIVPWDIRLDLYKLNKHFIENNVTHTSLPTQVTRLFIDEVDDTSLKFLITGGEKLGEINHSLDYILIDAYGPTECCVSICSIEEKDKLHFSSIGHIYDNVKAYVLDEECRRVPIGAVGELCISGYCVSEGYLNRDDESERAFLDNPFESNDEYGRLYRTGDMVRLLPDGSLGIIGRQDSQVKIRGNRVELSEIEIVIRELDFVDDVTVQTIKVGSNYEVAAYVVLNKDFDDDVVYDNICSYVGECKPDYMIPSFVVRLDSIPLNINGKVDKRALPDVDLNSLKGEYDAPSNETERNIVDAFEVAFNQKGIGLFDDFVRLGGDSITAIRVISLIEKKGISLTARDILKYKTPYLIAQHATENIKTQTYDPVEGIVNLLPIQTYFFNQINRNNFTQQFVLKAKDKIDITILQKALNKVINTHDMLRAVYKFDENHNPVQEIQPIDTHICEINNYSISNNFNENLKQIITNSIDSINVSDKLIDISLVNHDEESYLVLVIHHLIVDGISWNILLNDLSDVYLKLSTNTEIDLTRPYPYKNWVNDVKQLVENISDEEKQHWIEVNELLDDLDIKGPANNFNFNVNVKYNFNDLLNLTEEEFMALAISRAYKKTYAKDIIFNRESYGRDENIANLNRTVGWFTSQYPVIVKTTIGRDDISLMNDVYNLKKAFNDVNHLGLNYTSLIYIMDELEFKQCPVTFNFLSTEFEFENELFKSDNRQLIEIDEDYTYETSGVSLNVTSFDGSYVISGDYADGTYISDDFDIFVENFKSELEFIANYEFNNIVCALSESQLGVYLDEKVNDKGISYSTLGLFECDDYSIDEIKDAVYSLIDRYPILRGRILDNGDLPILVCDANPPVEVVDEEDYFTLVNPFDLDKYLARFFIVDNSQGRSLFYDLHHIISDATTTSIVNNELDQALNRVLDKSVDLGFVYSSHDSFDSKFDASYQSAHEFFIKQFEGIDEVHELLEDIGGCEGYVSLPIREIREDVEEFAHKNGITVATLLNAVFAYTYSRFTGSDKVQFNFTEHGRHDGRVADSVGMFVRTIPILMDCKDDSIENYLSEFSDLALNSMSNDVYPFRLLAGEFNLKNNVIFEYNYDLNDVSSIEDEIIVSTDTIGSVTEFACLINDLDDGFVIHIDHCDRYSNDTCVRFAKAYSEILNQMLVKENLADINFTSSEDITILDSYNKTEYDFGNADILDVFNDNLEKYADNPLVGYVDGCYTHAQGAFIANEVGNRLNDLNVSRNDNVSLFLNRSEWVLLASMGVLSHGSAYVPIETSYPDERIILMLKDTDSKVVIVEDKSEQRICNIILDNDLDVDVLNISDITECEVSSSNHLNTVEVDENHIACILYTSGTTGVPKGVPVTRKAVNNFVSWYVKETGFTSDDVYGMHCSYVFDIHTAALYSPVITGGCLHVVPEDIRLDLKALNEFYVEHGCTHTYITSQMGKLFAESGMDTSIKLLCFGGMKLGELNAPDSIGPFETYGPSENLAVSTSIFANERIHSSSIGRFISNVKGYVLDKQHRRVPIGAVGELYLSGAQLTPGYLNRESETRASFFNNPFDDEEGYEHIYNTGDLVRFLPDGTLSIIGRRDGQVKIRGNRVELAEVESTIRNMNLVEDVTAQITDDNELVAYVVVSEDIDDNNLRDAVCDYVNDHKPDYMVPSFVIKLDTIPLTVNGKVDKHALPDVEISNLHEEYIAPTNITEKQIVTAFEKVFNQENIGIHDDFIRLGGDSLTAVKLLTYLEDLNITVAEVLSLRTPFDIARNINKISFKLDDYSLEEGCPLNEPQLNVYLDIIANNKVDAYHIPLFMEIPNEYSTNEICDALDTMLNVHPILGMCISNDYEIPCLIKGSKPSISVASDIDEEYLTKAFDLNDSLCRFLIIENDNGHSLYAVFHHIIFDALSDNVFKQDILKILEGGVIDIDDSFLKVSAFNQKIKDTSEYDEANEFYDYMLADRDETGVLLDSALENDAGISSMDLELDLTVFNKILNKWGISENAVFTGVFAYTLSRFTGSNKTLFNIIENGRDRFNNYHSIGMYVNTLPLLVDCINQDVKSFMSNISDLVYDAMKYNYYPFRILANEYDIDSNVLFQFIPDWINDENINPSNIEIGNVNNMISDLAANVIQNANKYNLTIIHSCKYSKEFIQRFMETYKLILHEITHINELKDINYILQSDLNLLDEINKTDHPLKYHDVLDAFNDNLTSHPDNELVVYKDKSYSYANGAYISDKIGEKLHELGVKSQDCVSFLVERSESYMFSVLAISAMGGVYVPLDDNLPDERLEFIVKDTDSKVVIVTDETYERASQLFTGRILLNISTITDNEVGEQLTLPVVYGDLACILYTSGTTGIPKGVKITRNAILNVCANYCDVYEIGNDDVYGLFSTIGFDAGPLAISTVLYSGSSLAVVPEDIRFNINKLNEYFIKKDITHTMMTTQIGKLFIKNIDKTSLKVLLVGGEKLGKLENPKDYLLVDGFGPTELFSYITSINNSEKIDSSSIGFLNYNTKAYVLDDEHRQVPVGAVGELYIAGSQVAQGYLNLKEETDNSFVNNPFDDNEDYNLLYRTGDLVRILPDKSFAIVGRRDSQVKIRGNRVELSEVESVIREIDYIEDVSVQTIKHGDNNELVAYVVPSVNMDDLKDLICDYVSSRKPDYIVPSFVVELESIPLNVNGKVDKRALPEVDMDSLHEDYVPPTTVKENAIVVAFKIVFNQENIGIYDDFIRLGGDSITAIRIITILEKNSITTTAGDILKYKTPYLIAQHSSENAKSVYYDAVEGIVDLLPIQSYFFNEINRDNFTQQFVLKTKEELDINILQEAVDELTNIHDMMRAVYKHDDNDNTVNEILPVNTRICEINEHQVRKDLNKSIEEILINSIESINIEDNLVNFHIVHYGDEHYLIIVIHHLITDGVSWNVLLSDLTDIYLKLTAKQEVDIARPYPYKHWVEDVKQLVENISDEEKQHWIEINELLDDSKIKGSAKTFDFKIDANYNPDNLLMLSEEEFWALAISRAYKKTYGKDIIFNRESHGRDENIANLNRTIGWFTSQYPVPVEINVDYDDISLMKDVYSIKTAFNDINHLGLNYMSLIYTTKELEFKHSPVTFNFLSREFEFENELFESINQKLSDFDRNVSIEENHNSYGVIFNVSSIDNYYFVTGDYAQDTFIAEEFDAFIDNIREELKFIGNHDFDSIVCELSEPQLGIYLDEKVNDKGTAYSAPGIFEFEDYSIDEVKDAIHTLIDKHPILKGRILDTDNVPFLICDTDPSIEIITDEDYESLIKPFDFDKSLARFFIMDNKFIFYDIHHIINDATSRTIINKELDLALKGELDSSVDLGFVYASRDSFNSKFENNYKEAHEFFKNSLSDIDEVTGLWDDMECNNTSISLPIHNIREDIEAFCHENGITKGSFFNGIFAYTFSRFIGNNIVSYNFTEHGRHENYCQESLGMYTRTIPIMINCENNDIKNYLAYVSDLILDSMKYSSYPFRLLAKEFELANEITFEYNYDLNEISDVDDELIIEDNILSPVSKLLCVINDLDDGYIIKVETCKKYSDGAIRFLKAFKKVLIQALDKKQLKDIDYVDNEDLAILDEINETNHPLEYEDIMEAFNDNLSRYPDNTLVLSDECSYTYSQGAFMVDNIQKMLNDNGIGVNDVVSVFVERNHMVLLCNLGVLSVGATYVPIDENHPNDRIRYMIENSESKAIITSDRFKKRVDEIIEDMDSDLTVINVSSLFDDVGELDTLTYSNPRNNDVACILFTSGTTGNPKAVQVGRYSITNMVSYYQYNSDFKSDDVYGVFASVGFDVSLQHYVALFTGGAVTWVPNDIKLNIQKLNEYFIRFGVTHTIITTQVSKLFIQSIDSTSIRNLCAVGEKLGAVIPPEEYTFVDVYGPTEATSSMTSINVADKIDDSSVGGPDWNTKIYILDSNQKRVPFGAVGELYISGYQVSKGYLNNPEANKKAFFTNPFDGEISGYETMYKTGDVVHLLSDGTIGFIGRNDSQVKIRGNRVELSEIESSIREIDYIDDVTVQTIDHDGNNELVAYVVSSKASGIKNISENIKDHIRQYKPDYLVPTFVITMDEIPLNVNGKVDKKALPSVDMDSLHAEYVPPTTQMEKDIVEAFEKVFNNTRIGIYDDFISLGGDSLTAIKLVNYLEDYDISMAEVLSLRTPSAIAGLNDIDFDLDIFSVETGCPLNTAQLNVYADILTHNKYDSYKVSFQMEISEKYNIDAVINALEEMIEVHPILGMCLSSTHEVPFLVKGPKPPISVESNINPNEILDFFTQPFDLHNSLSRFLIVKNDESYMLFAVFHHIIFDALSLNVFQKDMQIILNGGAVNVDYSFLKSSAFTYQLKNSKRFVEASEFYDSMMKNIGNAGVLREDDSAKGYQALLFDLKFDNDAFKSFLNNAGVSENVLFTSVFAYTLSQFVDNDDVLFTIIENGRDRFNDYDSIGMNASVMPLLADCRNRSIGSFMKHMSEIIYGVIRHNYYPYAMVARKYNFTVSVLFQYLPEWIFDSGGISESTDLTYSNNILKDFNDFITEFGAQLYQNGDNYTLMFVHSNNYSEEMTRRFAETYALILSKIIHMDLSCDIKDILD